MKTHVLTSLILAVASGSASAANTRLDCRILKASVPYKAEVINDGTMNRSVQVTFARRISAIEATVVIQACVNEAAAKNSALDALGSAWVGSKSVALSKGKYYAYLSRSKTYQFM